MDKNAETMINELNRKIESLQAKREAVIRKDKERKNKAQEKWRSVFLKEFMKGAVVIFGENYEEDVPPEELASQLTACLKQTKRTGKEEQSDE